MKVVRLTIGRICLLLSLSGGCAMIAARTVSPRSIANIQVSGISSQGNEIKIHLKAALIDSSCSVENISTEIAGSTLFIKVTERFVMFVSKEKIKGDIELDLTVPSSVKDVRFIDSDKAIWTRPL